ncbi:MAG: hypothetical protein S4CHLAM81_07570 [Chlamydiales bacterium]|nr:hypothetical protein [Chlamydiales bacterium]MCH9635540.1 hypothetical protein [Chlamydiales bacterium]MCH9704128.1 hypothetical protein [Chlamydiota bacterium]
MSYTLATKSFSRPSRPSHHELARAIKVGEFIIDFDKRTSIIVRLADDRALEIILPTLPSNEQKFVIGRPTAVAFCTRSSGGFFSEEYREGTPLSEKFARLFSSLIRQEQGGHPRLDTRVIMLKKGMYL